jgi:hypothetical protein
VVLQVTVGVPTTVRSTPVAFRSSVMTTVCRSLLDPLLMMTLPVAGSYSTGMLRRYVNGTPIEAYGLGLCLSIRSTGTSRLLQLGRSTLLADRTVHEPELVAGDGVTRD